MPMAGGSPAKDSVTDALVYRYARSDDHAPTLDGEGAANLLCSIPEETLAGNANLLSAIKEQDPDVVLPAEAWAVIGSIGDCTKMISSLAPLSIEVDQQVRFALPILAAELIKHPDLPFREGASILTLLDHLVDATLGWDSTLERGGERIYKKLQETIDQVRLPNADIAALDEEVVTFFDKERGRISKLEERLAATETGQLRTQQSKVIAATMINQAMEGKQLTESIVDFLKGPWYDSAQLIVLTKGLDSEEWFRASKMTETIIWTYQPFEGENAETEKQRLYRIIEHLPGEIHDLLVALKHSDDAAASELDAIESDHVSIISGQELEYVEFEPIEYEDEGPSRAKASRAHLRRLNNLEPGQWFTYDYEHLSIRLKLVLKLEDIHQMLFTNRNGMKVMQRSFEEVAQYLTSGIMKPLSADAVFSTTFRNYYEGLINEHQRQLQRLAERKAEADREEQEREEQRRIEEAEAAEQERQREEEERRRAEEEKQARLERAREEATKAENSEMLEGLKAQVDALNVGAWLRLPGLDGQLEECKLAVRIQGSDKMIFVTRSGTKIGEYTGDQLVDLLVAGEGEIETEGVEFEDTLAQVVSRLREDRTKSYGDLTGQ